MAAFGEPFSTALTLLLWLVRIRFATASWDRPRLSRMRASAFPTFSNADTGELYCDPTRKPFSFIWLEPVGRKLYPSATFLLTSLTGRSIFLSP